MAKKQSKSITPTSAKAVDAFVKAYKNQVTEAENTLLISEEYSINVIQRIVKLKDYYIVFTISEKIGGYGTPIGPRPRIDSEFFNYPKNATIGKVTELSQTITVTTKLYEIIITVVETGTGIMGPPRSPFPPSPSILFNYNQLI